MEIDDGSHSQLSFHIYTHSQPRDRDWDGVVEKYQLNSLWIYFFFSLLFNKKFLCVFFPSFLSWTKLVFRTFLFWKQQQKKNNFSKNCFYFSFSFVFTHLKKKNIILSLVVRYVMCNDSLNILCDLFSQFIRLLHNNYERRWCEICNSHTLKHTLARIQTYNSNIFRFDVCCAGVRFV